MTTYSNSSSSPDSVNNVFPFILINARMRIWVFINSEEEKHTPNSAGNSKEVEDRGPTSKRFYIRQETTQRHRNHCTKLGTCQHQTKSYIEIIINEK